MADDLAEQLWVEELLKNGEPYVGLEKPLRGKVIQLLSAPCANNGHRSSVIVRDEKHSIKAFFSHETIKEYLRQSKDVSASRYSKLKGSFVNLTKYVIQPFIDPHKSRCEFQLHVNGFKVVDPPSSETWNCDFMPVLECESIRRKLVDLWMQQEDKGSLTESLVEEMIIPSDAQEALDQVPGWSSGIIEGQSSSSMVSCSIGDSSIGLIRQSQGNEIGGSNNDSVLKQSCSEESLQIHSLDSIRVSKRRINDSSQSVTANDDNCNEVAAKDNLFNLLQYSANKIKHRRPKNEGENSVLSSGENLIPNEIISKPLMQDADKVNKASSSSVAVIKKHPNGTKLRRSKRSSINLVQTAVSTAPDFEHHYIEESQGFAVGADPLNAPLQRIMDEDFSGVDASPDILKDVDVGSSEHDNVTLGHKSLLENDLSGNPEIKDRNQLSPTVKLVGRIKTNNIDGNSKANERYKKVQSNDKIDKSQLKTQTQIPVNGQVHENNENVIGTNHHWDMVPNSESGNEDDCDNVLINNIPVPEEGDLEKPSIALDALQEENTPLDMDVTEICKDWMSSPSSGSGSIASKDLLSQDISGEVSRECSPTPRAFSRNILQRKSVDAADLNDVVEAESMTVAKDPCASESHLQPKICSFQVISRDTDPNSLDSSIEILQSKESMTLESPGVSLPGSSDPQPMVQVSKLDNCLQKIDKRPRNKNCSSDSVDKNRNAPSFSRVDDQATVSQVNSGLQQDESERTIMSLPFSQDTPSMSQMVSAIVDSLPLLSDQEKDKDEEADTTSVLSQDTPSMSQLVSGITDSQPSAPQKCKEQNKEKGVDVTTVLSQDTPSMSQLIDAIANSQPLDPDNVEDKNQEIGADMTPSLLQDTSMSQIFSGVVNSQPLHPGQDENKHKEVGGSDAFGKESQTPRPAIPALFPPSVKMENRKENANESPNTTCSESRNSASFSQIKESVTSTQMGTLKPVKNNDCEVKQDNVEVTEISDSQESDSTLEKYNFDCLKSGSVSLKDHKAEKSGNRQSSGSYPDEPRVDALVNHVATLFESSVVEENISSKELAVGEWKQDICRVSSSSDSLSRDTGSTKKQTGSESANNSSIADVSQNNPSVSTKAQPEPLSTYNLLSSADSLDTNERIEIERIFDAEKIDLPSPSSMLRESHVRTQNVPGKTPPYTETAVEKSREKCITILDDKSDISAAFSTNGNSLPGALYSSKDALMKSKSPSSKRLKQQKNGGLRSEAFGSPHQKYADAHARSSKLPLDTSIEIKRVRDKHDVSHINKTTSVNFSSSTHREISESETERAKSSVAKVSGKHHNPKASSKVTKTGSAIGGSSDQSECSIICGDSKSKRKDGRRENHQLPSDSSRIKHGRSKQNVASIYDFKFATFSEEEIIAFARYSRSLIQSKYKHRANNTENSIGALDGSHRDHKRKHSFEDLESKRCKVSTAEDGDKNDRQQGQALLKAISGRFTSTENPEHSRSWPSAEVRHRVSHYWETLPRKPFDYSIFSKFR